MAASAHVDVNQSDRCCSFCDRTGAPYTCPRCNRPYCSSNCYKTPQHSQCSEIFYRDCVEEHLKATEHSPAARRRVQEILQRVYQKEEELDSDDDYVPDLHERFSEIDLENSKDNDDSIWDKLTDAEKQEFKNLIDNGNVNSLLPVLEPWWRSKEEIKLIEEIDEQTRHSSSLPVCPPIKDNIPPLKQLLSKVPASPYLKYNLINVLYAYAYVVRFYNGDHREFALESMENVLKISGNLAENQNYNDTLEAVTSAMYTLEQNKELANSQAFVVEIIADVKFIVEGPGDEKRALYILAALTDLDVLAQSSRKSIKGTEQNPLAPFSDSWKPARNADDDKELISKLRRVEKKLLFYMSWSKDHHRELLPIIAELDLFHASKLREMKVFDVQRTEVAAAMKKKTLKSKKIEEL